MEDYWAHSGVGPVTTLIGVGGVRAPRGQRARPGVSGRAPGGSRVLAVWVRVYANLFWPCRYQIEAIMSYQIVTKQDHA